MKSDNCQLGPKAYTVPQAAKALNISSSTAWKMVRDGRLQSVRIGERRVVVPIQVVDEMLKIN